MTDDAHPAGFQCNCPEGFDGGRGFRPTCPEHGAEDTATLERLGLCHERAVAAIDAAAPAAPLPQAAIDAEKAAKPRPDLVPARVVWAWWTSAADDPEPSTALRELVRFGDTGDLAHLWRALDLTSDVLGVDSSGALDCMGRVMGYGFRKHGVCTWRIAGTEQADPQTHYASAMRHFLEYDADAQARESGSGFPVLWHAMSQIAILADLVLCQPSVAGENDGRWSITAQRWAPTPVLPATEPSPAPSVALVPIDRPLPYGWRWTTHDSDGWNAAQTISGVIAWVEEPMHDLRLARGGQSLRPVDIVAVSACDLESLRRAIIARNAEDPRAMGT